MAADRITAIEDALIARCTAALTTSNGQRLVRQVESLPGDWDDDMLRRLLRAVPGVFVAFGGGGAQAGATAEIRARWLVYVVTGHASGEAARRRGDAQEAGAYLITSLLVTALHAWAPGAAENALQLVDVSNLYTGSIDRQGVAVYAITLEAPLAFDPLVADDLGDFITFNGSTDVPPFSPEATHRRWLVGDDSQGAPDARDTVTLAGDLAP